MRAAFFCFYLLLMCPTPLPHATTKDIFLWLLRRYHRLRIHGNSMTPTLQPHQEVLINPRAYRHFQPLPGEIVVVEHPHQAGLFIVKRILFVELDGRCYLQGDNRAESTDSRQLGLFPLKQISGRVHCLFP